MFVFGSLLIVRTRAINGEGHTPYYCSLFLAEKQPTVLPGPSPPGRAAARIRDAPSSPRDTRGYRAALPAAAARRLRRFQVAPLSMRGP